ncbi:cytochrome c oxidase assembly protein COX16 homolog, mitochondrial [Dermacentor silvarum]|uniref:cytochrome c oxidase assembly protein COX16 homolog, mitochondrial n=1 Tax=Dermacentor silvarum TaxID=543639 RepID=UPI001898597B|nr:cytochrome c oxidase assembly protein COX16 homolog, mitochondrial [Dermacentor silvarum]
MAAVYLRSVFQYVYKRKFLRLGVPFMVFMVGGSIGLKQFTSLRYEFRKQEFTREDAEEAGIKMKEPEEVSIEAVYKEIQSVDIDNWKNVRGPRPWEEGNEYNKILKERQMMKQQSGES